MSWRAFCAMLAWHVELVEPQPGRPSVLGRLPGAGAGPALLLNAHTDTVGFGAMADPLTPRVEQGRLHGRGAYDMKGGLAAVLLAAAELARGPRLRGDLIVMAVADEEHASLGTAAALAQISWLPAHRSTPRSSPSRPTSSSAWRTRASPGPRLPRAAARPTAAAAPMESMRSRIWGACCWRSSSSTPSSSSARPTRCWAMARCTHPDRGRQRASTYPARCALQIERRTLPGETADSVAGEIDALLGRLRAADPRFSAEAELTLFRPPLETAADAPIVAALASTAGQILGAEPPLVGATFWMDSALLGAAGIPTAIFGPRGAGPHADVEWVELASAQACADVLAATARVFCGVA